MGYSAQSVANYFLGLGDAEDKEITPLVVQKLVYLAHGWFLAIMDKPLVDDEFAEAWRYGPIFPSLYYEFSEFGRGPIDRRAFEYRFNERTEVWNSWVAASPSGDFVKKFLGHIWSVYKGFTPAELSSLTGQSDSPWCLASYRGKVKNAHIENDAIKKYYKSKLKRSEEREV